MLDLFELQKDITLGKKIIVAPKEAENSDLAAIVDCIKGGQDIALDLSETKITNIGTEFRGCKALKAIVLPEGLVSIGDHAFCGCEVLTSILIPASVTSIGEGAFSGCKSLTAFSITFAAPFGWYLDKDHTQEVGAGMLVISLKSGKPLYMRCDQRHCAVRKAEAARLPAVPAA